MDQGEDEKQLSYSQRLKKECSNAAGLCFWDRIVESFKVKGREGEEAQSQPKGYQGNEVELQQQKEGYETQLVNQREHFLTQLQEKEAIQVQEQQDFEEKLLQTQRDCAGQLEQAETTIRELRQELRLSKERCIEIQNITDLVQQYEFVVPNFSRLRKERVGHTTPPMYSRPGGYKFIIEITAAGTKTGAGSHVSVQVFTQIGEYDTTLSFPAKLSITIQLLNQEDKREGHTKLIACVYRSSGNGEFMGSDLQFISTQELENKASVYLKNNQLWFRITDIRVDALSNK